MNFRLWMENSRPVVSFDFDGVLHTDVYPGTIHPINWENADLTPNEEMFRKMREEAAGNTIVVVTGRDDVDLNTVWEFIHNHRLPVTQVYTTNNRQKLPVLKHLGVIRHYDDNPMMAYELDDSGIEFILVRPKPSAKAIEAARGRGWNF